MKWKQLIKMNKFERSRSHLCRYNLQWNQENFIFVIYSAHKYECKVIVFGLLENFLRKTWHILLIMLMTMHLWDNLHPRLHNTSSSNAPIWTNDLTKKGLQAEKLDKVYINQLSVKVMAYWKCAKYSTI